jgi:hypothetical protein
MAGCLVFGCGASVRRLVDWMSVQAEMHGGPDTDDPGQIRHVKFGLPTLILKACGITAFQPQFPS